MATVPAIRRPGRARAVRLPAAAGLLDRLEEGALGRGAALAAVARRLGVAGGLAAAGDVGGEVLELHRLRLRGWRSRAPRASPRGYAGQDRRDRRPDEGRTGPAVNGADMYLAPSECCRKLGFRAKARRTRSSFPVTGPRPFPSHRVAAESRNGSRRAQVSLRAFFAPLRLRVKQSGGGQALRQRRAASRLSAARQAVPPVSSATSWSTARSILRARARRSGAGVRTSFLRAWKKTALTLS